MEYFAIIFEFPADGIRPGFVQAFFQKAESFGLRFLHGCRSAENMTFEQLIETTEEEFLTNERDAFKSYQYGFSFHKFSSVVGFWNVFSNSITGRNYTTFNLMIPEEDFMEGSFSLPVKRNDSAMRLVKELAVQIWDSTDVCCIQTAWEWSYVPPLLDEIREGEVAPQVEPFAVMPRSVCSDDLLLESAPLSKNGVLLENGNGWLFSI